jgi:mannosylglycerate hydrolase
MLSEPRPIVVVPHTHWDREWYSPYQTFRMKLVDLTDELLDMLESDPSFRHFMFDGQMAVVDDYLAVRPENEERLRRLAASGRLGMGPWYILMDEFLVSGETMIRDLQLGFERAAAFGGAMEVGYLPDMFGHIAQMPQLLRQFGLKDAVVWRGVPSAIDKGAFWWEAPDGSTVRAEYLVEGYGNGAALPDDAKELVALVRRFESDYDSFLQGPILWMNGTDHQLPMHYLGRVLSEANEIQDDYRFRVGSLAEYLEAAPTAGLAEWKGELRSGARAPLLMGVASNRVDVKQAAAVAERTLERLAEPLSALFLPRERWPRTLLAEAWLEMIRNSAHDSSCACSVDEVCSAVLHRYAEARQIGEGLTERAVRALTTSLAEPGHVALNPSARARRGVVELRLPGTAPVPGTQVLHVSDGRAGADGITRSDAVTLTQAAIDGMSELRDVEIEIDDDGVLDVRLHCAFEDDGARRYAGSAKSYVSEAARQNPDGPARIAIVTPASQKVLAWVDDVPGFGWAHIEPGGPPAEVEAVEVTGDESSPTITNGLLTVVVDAGTGTFSLDGVAGLGRLVDDGDTGDTYNYNTPRRDAVVDEPDAVEVRIIEAGPLRARVEIVRSFRWPERAFFNERGGEKPVETTTMLEVRAGSDLVSITTEFDNPSRDHRVRAWFPLPEPARTSTAECAFAVVERGLEAEGGPTELGLPTYPSRRFVCAGGLTVVHEGLLEYELVDIRADRAHALALTLLRCTGLLSNGPMPYRPLPAGPVVAAEDAQMIGPQVLRYGIRMADDVEGAYRSVDEAFLPLITAGAPGGGDRPARGTALGVTGAEVSAVVREGGELIVRVFNPGPTPSTVRIEGRRGWLTDLRGRPLDPFEESFELGPWRIATAQLAD